MSLPVPGWRLWGRRISFGVLIVGLGYLVVRLLLAQPVEVQVDYHLGSAARGLEAATMVYIGQGGETLRRVRFNYSVDDHPAPRVQPHRVKVPRGEHRIRLELRFRGDPPPGLGGARSGNTLRLRRPLVVDGQGRVSVFVGE